MKGFIGTQTALIAALIISLTSLSALLVNVSGLLQEPETTFGGTGPAAIFASSSSGSVGTSVIRLFATSTCAARIVSVRNGSDEIRFLPFDVPTATDGILLTATSSPYIFPAEDLGCGTWLIISATGATANYSVTETF